MTAIYNHYVEHDHATFDVVAFSVEQRRTGWFDRYFTHGPHRLLVAEDDGEIVGYVTSSPFRPKPAYAATVETTVYVAPGRSGQGHGRALYAALFAALAGTAVHTAVAGIALPNAASVALHRAVGFRSVGTFTAVGRKFGRWIDVAWFQRELDAADPVDRP